MKIKIVLLAVVVFCISACALQPTKPVYQPTSLEVFNEAQNHLPIALQKIIPALRERNFAYLEGYYGALLATYSKNPTDENDLNLAFDLIHKTNQDIGEELNQYVTLYPNSYVAHTIRGVYWVNKGWSRRGGAFIGETNESQIDAMTKSFDLALLDLDSAIRLNPNDVYANTYKIDVLMNFRSRESEVIEAYNRALKANPVSLRARSYYLTTLEPRWGGSLEKMYEFIENSKKYANKNPLLSSLDARIYSFQAEVAWNKGDLDMAIANFNKAALIDVGIYREPYYRYIGIIFYDQKRYAEARSYFERAIDARPTRLDSHRYNLLIKK